MISSAVKDYLSVSNVTAGQYARLLELGYLDAPASKGHHLAVPGGLARHSVNVTRRLVSLSREMGVEWSRDESPYFVGMLHDLVKCQCYRLNPDGRTYSYVQPKWPGHGVALDAFPGQIIATHTADWSASRLDESGDWSDMRSEAANG